jgi:hypothetical protein
MIPDQWRYRYEAFRDTIKTASDANGIPVAIICAVIAQESSWREFCPARYEAGFQKKYINPQFPKLPEKERRELASSYGPMQIMYVVAREIGFKGTVLPCEKGGKKKDCASCPALCMFNETEIVFE